jgi:hypothetical protein
MTSKITVPYFLLRIDQGLTEVDTSATLENSDLSSSLHRTKALFTVPEDLVAALIVHPVLCCGSSFTLTLENTGSGSHPKMTLGKTIHRTSFISTTFDSLDPESTAHEISRRISVRIDNIGPLVRSMQTSNVPVDSTSLAAAQKDWVKTIL